MSDGVPWRRLGYLLSLIGGIVIIAGGALVLLGGLAHHAPLGRAGLGSGAAVVFGAAAAVFGIIILLFALQVDREPQRALTNGVVILVLALFSLVAASGLVDIGVFLAVLGALVLLAGTVLGNRWGLSSSPSRACLGCGTVQPAQAQYCSKCGRAMPPG